MNRLLIVTVLFLATLFPQPGGVNVLAQERIAAIVNDDIISRRDLNERTKLALLITEQPNNEATRRRMAGQVLRGVIDEKLQLQEADRLDLSATDNEIQRSLNDIASRNNMSTQQLVDFLQRNDVDPAALREQVAAQIAWIKTVRTRINPRVQVTNEQVGLILDQQRASVAEPQVQLSEIVLPVYSADQEAEVLENARDLLESLEDDADFGALAQQLSVGATAAKGGDLGWVSLASMTATFRDALLPLPVGSLSEPVRSPQGVHVFEVRDRRSSAAAVAESNQLSLAQLYFEATGDAEAAAAAGRAEILIPRLTSCERIAEVAESEGSPGSGLLGWIDPTDLPTALQNAVAELEQGQLSAPVRGPSGVHLLMVCATREAGNADEAQRTQIRQRLENEQTERLASRYLRDLRLDAFIEIRL